MCPCRKGRAIATPRIPRPLLTAEISVVTVELRYLNSSEWKISLQRVEREDGERRTKV
jgi:hypothetical protein